jgi:hypothetical protein
MSTSTDVKEPDIEITEQPDGSVAVELPEDLAPPVADDDDGGDDRSANAKAEGGPADDPADDDADDDTVALRNAKRERRRAKRELARKTSAEKDQRLQLLQRQNQELMERLSVVERKTHAGELAKLDKAVEDQELRLEYAKRKIAEATRAQDGDALAQAQEMWYESRQQLEALKNIKKASTSPRQQNSLPDPRVQKMAADWIKRSEWYDPQHRDTDSKIVKQIDEELTAEGWNPATQDYWDELDDRAKKYLPHRYELSYNAPNQRSRPRNMQTSTGRESSNSGGSPRGQFMLEPEQVRAMKDAGFWDDPVKRNSMIKRYAAEARKRAAANPR